MDAAGGAGDAVAIFCAPVSVPCSPAALAALSTAATCFESQNLSTSRYAIPSTRTTIIARSRRCPVSFLIDRWGIKLDRRLQSFRGHLVDPREQKHSRKADGHQNDNQPVGPGRNLKHVKDDVYGVENEPARDQVKDPDPDNVAVFQLLEESELNRCVMGVHVP